MVSLNKLEERLDGLPREQREALQRNSEVVEREVEEDGLGVCDDSM